MRRIADAKQSFAAPIAQTIDLHGEQFDLRPVVQLGHAVAQKSGEADNFILKLRQTARFDLVETALGNDEAALPVIAAVEQDEQLAVLKKPNDCSGSSCFFEIRIQSASIGTPNSRRSKPARG